MTTTNTQNNETEKDKIEIIRNTQIQHGKLSDRIYVMELCADDCPEIVYDFDSIAKEQGYSKIFAKVPSAVKGFFEKNGYVVEAEVPKFFADDSDGYFMAKYFDDKRQVADRAGEVLDIRETAKKKMADFSGTDFGPLPAGHTMRVCKESDAEDMAKLYSAVFESYPFPIFDPEYLIETMKDNFLYFGVWDNGRLVALSSCEMDKEHGNVEMTDFSTLPVCRGKGLAKHLLAEMDKVMKEQGFRVGFTIARAISMPMNLVFANNGYKFSGTLVNNTNIAGCIESMNVWWKWL
jgi:putative beta-lysine N-acetyltransferase